jgi:hypothetical protein
MRRFLRFSMLATLACRAPIPMAEPRSIGPIRQPEISTAAVGDAYELVARLRPAYLHRERDARGPTMVVENSTVLGTMNVLRGYPLLNVRRISYLSASECEQRFGASRPMPNGAVWIETR